MYKLGILGTCNTHAVIFSSLFNKPGCEGSGFYSYGRAKVEYIFGFDKEKNAEIARFFKFV